MTEEKTDKSENDPQEELIRQLQKATGLINFEGQLFWSQQQWLEKLDDPMAKRLVEVIHTIPMDQRTWKKILKKYQENHPS